jgi:hypothetical protein
MVLNSDDPVDTINMTENACSIVRGVSCSFFVLFPCYCSTEKKICKKKSINPSHSHTLNAAENRSL